MRASIIIAAHNEGDRLWRTVASCVETSAGLDCEIVVADDASWDGSVEETLKRFPQVRVVRHDERKGVSPTKDLGARHARGETLVFLDGHTKPEPGAIERLIEDVERLKGDAIITPTVTGLCVTRWKTLDHQQGHGYSLELERLDCAWLRLSSIRPHPHRGRMFYECPALIGCAFAVHRELYDDLRGFDPHMLCWGVEGLDFGLKSWLMGHPILHDPEPVIGHRFQQRFDNFEVPIEQLLVNQLRLARKNFTEAVWSDWIERCRNRNSGSLAEHPEGLWARAWELFGELRPSAEQERGHLLARRVRDEFWYAERFGLTWPMLQSERFEPGLRAFGAGAADSSPSPSPSPSPPPCDDCSITRNAPAGTGSLVIGQKVSLTIACSAGTISGITWTVPGQYVKNYVANDNAGTLTFLDSTDLSQATITFYWVQPGTYSVTVAFTLTKDGIATSCEKSISLVVVAPTLATAWPTMIGMPTPVNGTGVQLAGSTDFVGSGIAFKASVTDPAGLGLTGAGSWQFVQTVTWYMSGLSLNDNKCYSGTPPTAGRLCDNTYPYSGPYAAGGAPQSTNDSREGQGSTAALGYFREESYFFMYVMYKPPVSAGQSAIWVAIAVLPWTFEFCAMPFQGNWTIVENGSVQRGWSTNLLANPTWLGKYTNGQLNQNQIDCPGPCTAPPPPPD